MSPANRSAKPSPKFRRKKKAPACRSKRGPSCIRPREGKGGCLGDISPLGAVDRAKGAALQPAQSPAEGGQERDAVQSVLIARKPLRFASRSFVKHRKGVPINSRYGLSGGWKIFEYVPHTSRSGEQAGRSAINWIRVPRH